MFISTEEGQSCETSRQRKQVRISSLFFPNEYLASVHYSLLVANARGWSFGTDNLCFRKPQSPWGVVMERGGETDTSTEF